MQNDEPKSPPQPEEDYVELGEVSKDTKGFVGGKYYDGVNGFWN